MQTGQVGQSYIPGQVKLEEQLRYRLDNEGHSLLIIKAGVTRRETEDIEQGTAQLGVYIDGPIIFFLFKFGTGKWNDAPYSWHTVPAGIRVYPEEAKETGTLTVTLVEAADGLVKAVRKIALATEFAAKLNGAITLQANCSFNGLSYAKHINLVYNQYNAEDMAAMTVAHMTQA
ncbi:MAG: hypothetical protein H6Q72_592 [Firmicutes bacterium]|nr:hypothetical protein [Bacillota bacterium]